MRWMWIWIIEYTVSFVAGDGGDEVDEIAPAEEFGDEECSTSFGFRRFDPLETRSEGAVLAASFS